MPESGADATGTSKVNEGSSMPAYRLGDNEFAVRKYDIVGQDSATLGFFVRHVGLSDEDRPSLRVSDELSLVHMGPPLRRGDSGLAVHIIGTVNLTSDDLRQVSVFIDEVGLEYEAEKVRTVRQYIVHPHVRSPDLNCPFRRFSCAGFVIEAYRDAGIELIAIESNQLPAVSLETLAEAYPDQRERLQDSRMRQRVGLEGDGPWPVILAGYTFNSLARSAVDIRQYPYVPVPGDEFFPPIRSSTTR